MANNDGGLIGALFSQTDRGKSISGVDYEIRKDKNGNDVVYKKGTNIYIGRADKLFDNKKYGGAVKGYRNGGCVMRGRGGKFKGIS